MTTWARSFGGRLRRIHKRLKLDPVKTQHPDLADRPHRCRPRPRRQQPDLAEVLAGPHRQHMHVPLGGRLRPLDLPSIDYVKTIGPIALTHDHLAAPEPRLLEVVRHLAQQRPREVRERRRQTPDMPRPGDRATDPEPRHIHRRSHPAKRPPRPRGEISTERPPAAHPTQALSSRSDHEPDPHLGDRSPLRGSVDAEPETLMLRVRAKPGTGRSHALAAFDFIRKSNAGARSVFR